MGIALELLLKPKRVADLLLDELDNKFCPRLGVPLLTNEYHFFNIFSYSILRLYFIRANLLFSGCVNNALVLSFKFVYCAWCVSSNCKILC